MNCPKCGSKLEKQIDQRTKKETGYWFCKEHRDLYTTKEVNEFYFYGRRLDKVLEKLNSIRLHFPRGISIQWEDNGQNVQFRLCGNSAFEDDSAIISLDTVECFIKDMEANNE